MEKACLRRPSPETQRGPAAQGCGGLCRSVGGGPSPRLSLGALSSVVPGPSQGQWPAPESPQRHQVTSPRSCECDLAQTANATYCPSNGEMTLDCASGPQMPPQVFLGERTAQGGSTPWGRPETWLGGHGGRHTLPRAREPREECQGELDPAGAVPAHLQPPDLGE